MWNALVKLTEGLGREPNALLDTTFVASPCRVRRQEAQRKLAAVYVLFGQRTIHDGLVGGM